MTWQWLCPDSCPLFTASDSWPQDLPAWTSKIYCNSELIYNEGGFKSTVQQGLVKATTTQIFSTANVQKAETDANTQALHEESSRWCLLRTASQLSFQPSHQLSGP